MDYFISCLFFLRIYCKKISGVMFVISKTANIQKKNTHIKIQFKSNDDNDIYIHIESLLAYCITRKLMPK